MRKVILLVATIGGVAWAGLHIAGQAPSGSHAPVFSADGRLLKPENYREWVWLSSGLGMSYGPSSQSTGRADPPFDNVFVTPEAHRSFMQTGTWPDKTVFVLEIRSSIERGSINQQGHYQGALTGMEVEVKDESRFPGKWAFFDFSGPGPSASPLPTSATCYSCHSRNGAVDNTFVQFYPTLLEVARQKGTLKNPREFSTPASEHALPASEHTFLGKVEGVDPRARMLTVYGDDVPGWMAAMTMTYSVSEEGVLGTVKVGDRITATVHDGDFQRLYDVRVVPPVSPKP
jgi:Cu/Ag efflux protein CusF